jgi:PAS domain S-box-containing protein
MAAVPESLAQPPSSQPRANILLVDDKPANLLVLRAVLDGLGQNLVDADSGAKALELLRDQEFAVVLLDVLMPGLSGFETARLIRKHPRSPHTPIVFLTAAEIDRPEIEEGYSLGAVDFLLKPIVPAILQAKVRGFIELFQDRQQARREAEQLRLLVDGTIDYAICMLDPDGHVATWNSGAERLTGYTAKEIIGEHFSRFYLKDAVERQQPCHGLDVARAEGRFEDDGWRVRKDGARFWANEVITVLRDEHGQLRGFSKITRDLTVRKQAEEALSRSEERFRLLVEGAKDYAIFLLDPQGYVVSWNPGAERIKQYQAREIIGQHFSRFYPQEAIDRSWPAQELEFAKARGRFEDEGWRVRKDGSQFWANVIITALRDDAGSLRGFSKITRDVTERKNAEDNARRLVEETTARRVAEENALIIHQQSEALLASEEKLRLLADTIPQLAWMARPDGHIFWYNQRWYQYTGTTPEQMAGWGWQAVHDPAILPAVLERWQKCIQTGEPLDMVFPLRGADGQFRPFLTRVNPLRDAANRVIYWCGTNTDISDIKKMEESLRDADRRKDEFLATLAHELRNPLAPIRNSLQILKMARVDPALAQQTRDMMERQVHHLVRLVDDLLDVSRVMRGKIELRKEPVELATVVAHAVETAQPLMNLQGHRLDVSVTSESLLVDADPVRLTQVIGNLLTNAAKYTEANGRIQLSAARDSDQAVLKVRDNGIGIAPDMLPHIFELFVQADHSSARTQGGLGIGLTLAKNLVEMHGGALEAHSSGLGEGSEFTIRLPLVAQEKRAPREQVNGEPPSERSTSGHRLLVVDDNKDAAISLAMLLRLQGYEVHVAHDGPAAIESATALHPDMIFLDIGMPGMDGYEVARRVRNTPGLEKTVLAALTGWGQQEDRRRSAEAGFDYHLVKPAEQKSLEQVLADLQQRT